MKQVLQRCEQATRQQQCHQQFLLDLFLQEYEARQQRRAARRVKEAKFPWVKTLDSFDFKRAPHLPETLIRQLAQGDYINSADPIYSRPTKSDITSPESLLKWHYSYFRRLVNF